jgi:Mitochondrial 39-S ribosomal protein L47 (MRP-L47)
VVRRFCVSSGQNTGAGPAKAAESEEAARRANEGIRGFLDAGEGAGATKTGRSWRAAELRLKSFDDLHRLWFVLLRERNTLLTEKAWCKTNGRHWLRGASNLYKVKRSMARLQGVVGERLRAFKTNRRLESQDEPSSGLADALKSPRPRRPGVVSRI